VIRRTRYLLPRVIASLMAAGGLLLAGESAAQYPSKAIRLVVPLAPGGGNDLLSRYMSQKLGESLGQQVIIDNRPGGSGMIGAEHVARSAPDGYTILMAGSGQMSINPSLYAKMPYDPARDFQPISIVGSFSSMLTAHPSLPVKTVHDIVRLAKEKPGQLNYASSGNGSGSHLSMELFKSMAKVNLVHIPYKGAGPALTDLLSGQVSLLFNNPLSSMPFVRSGRTRAIAVTGTKRLSAMPEVPTVAESGLPGFDSTIWLGFFLPAATPRDIVVRLNSEVVKIVQRPAVREWLAQQGMDAVGNTPEEFAARIRSDAVKWGAVIKASGARVD
jgi:tripartite-type tricarboxylate transporter receptor subunit TctC